MGDFSPITVTRFEFDRYTANIFPIVLFLKYVKLLAEMKL